MMQLKELQEILASQAISAQTREAIEEIIGSQSEGELAGDKEQTVREILEVELDISDLQAELSEKIVTALDRFSKEGNAAVLKEMREQSQQIENQVVRQFQELKDFASARLDLALSS